MSDVQAVMAFAEARQAEDKGHIEGLLSACRIPERVPDFTACGGPAAEAYWAHYGPRRMLREADARQEIIARHRPAIAGYGPLEDSHYCVAESSDEDLWYAKPWPCPTIRQALSVWSDHPDYSRLVLPALDPD